MKEKGKKVRKKKLCLNSNKPYSVGTEFLFVCMYHRLSISEGTPTAFSHKAKSDSESTITTYYIQDVICT